MFVHPKYQPVLKKGIPDYDADSSKWDDWMNEQEHYILNGYTVGGITLPGRFYFHLNFFKLLHMEEGLNYEVEMTPYYLDVQHEFYNLVESGLKDGFDIVMGKGRDKGFSYILASIALCEMMFRENTSILGVFPGGQSQALQKFQQKYDRAFNRLPKEMRYYPRLKENAGVYEYGWEERDSVTGERETLGPMNSLTMVNAVNPDIGKSGRYKWIFLEEFGELKDPLKIIVTNRANMQKGDVKFGITLAGGTSNAFNEGYKDFRKLWYNPRDYGFEKFFIPAQRMYFPFVDLNTGISDEKGAYERIIEKRKKLTGEERMIDEQNYPTSEAEMFNVIRKSPFPAELVSKQTHHILSNPEVQKVIQIGNLYSRRENGVEKVEFHLDPNGRWKVLLHPNNNNIQPDVAGVDSWRFAQVEQSDSKGSIVGYRPYQGANKAGNAITFIYHYRHDEKESFFEDCRLSAIYWNMKLLIEKTDQDIFSYIKSRNGVKWLKAKPKLFQSYWRTENSDYGISANMKAPAIEYAVEDFKKHHENIMFVELLDELADFGTKNTDLAMAYLWAVVHAHDNVGVLDEYKDKKVLRKKKPMPVAISDGKGGRRIIDSNDREKFPQLINN